MAGNIGPVFRLITTPGRFLSWLAFSLPGRSYGNEALRDDETAHLINTIVFWVLVASFAPLAPQAVKSIAAHWPTPPA